MALPSGIVLAPSACWTRKTAADGGGCCGGGVDGAGAGDDDCDWVCLRFVNDCCLFGEAVLNAYAIGFDVD